MARDGGAEIARRSRGTPRVANRLLRRVRDFASVGGNKVVDAKVADAALTRLEVDARGLDAMDRSYLACIAENYGGGPVGVDTLAAALSEQRDVIEDVIEPYLMQLGLLMRTPRGRLLSESGYRHLGKPMPKAQKQQQLDLLAGSPSGDGTQDDGTEEAGRPRPQAKSSTDGMCSRCGSTTRTPTPPGSSTTPTGCASSSAARTELLRLLGHEHSALRDERGVNWVVRRCALDYLKPARLDETIEVVTHCGELRGASLDMLQEARRGQDILLRAELVVACMNRTAGRRACRRACVRLLHRSLSATRPAHAIFRYKAKNNGDT